MLPGCQKSPPATTNNALHCASWLSATFLASAGMPPDTGDKLAESCAALARSSDKAETSVRFGCGFVFGLMCGTGTLVFGLATRERAAVALVVVVAVVCGLLAVRYGDLFWKRLSGWFWWWM